MPVSLLPQPIDNSALRGLETQWPEITFQAWYREMRSAFRRRMRTYWAPCWCDTGEMAREALRHHDAVLRSPVAVGKVAQAVGGVDAFVDLRIGHARVKVETVKGHALPLWQPQDAGVGRHVLTVPLWDAEGFVSDIVAFDPREPLWCALRRGEGSLVIDDAPVGSAVLGEVYAVDATARLYATVIDWLRDWPARKRQARTANERAFAALAPEPGMPAAGSHGAVVLDREGCNWTALLQAGQDRFPKRVICGDDGLAWWIGQRLKEERRRALPRYPDVLVRSAFAEASADNGGAA